MKFEGLLSSVDFEENEITIQVQGEIIISAGKYVVIDSESFESIETSRKELFEALQEIQIDLSILKSNFIQIEKTDSRAEGMTDIIDKWIERNKKAIEKALK